MGVGPRSVDEFGDPRLVSVDLRPTSDKQRKLTVLRDAVLWTSIGVTPALVSAAHVAGRPVEALVAAAAAVVLAFLVGWALRRTSTRYGVGLVPLCRAAFGPRGAPLVLLARWLVALLWLAAWIAPLSRDGARLGMASAAALGLEPTMGSGAAIEWLTLGIGAALVALLAAVAARGLRRVLRGAAWAALLAGWAGVALVVFARLLAPGVQVEPGAVSASELVSGAGGLLFFLVPALLAAPEWLRFARPRAGAGARWVAGLAAWAALPAALGVVAVHVWVGRAAEGLGRASAGRLVVDAAAFGGLAAGWLALAFGLCVVFWAAPLLALYAPSLALCGVWPRRLRYRRALAITALAAAGLVVLLGVRPGIAELLAPAAALLVPVVGVLLADEWVVRRGRVILEDLYQLEGTYRGVAGFGLAGLIALGAGWALLLLVGARTPAGLGAGLVTAFALHAAVGALARPRSRVAVAAPAGVAPERPKLKKPAREGLPRWAEADEELSDASWLEPEPLGEGSVTAGLTPVPPGEKPGEEG